jgi:hypothetical protein
LTWHHLDQGPAHVAQAGNHWSRLTWYSGPADFTGPENPLVLSAWQNACEHAPSFQRSARKRSPQNRLQIDLARSKIPLTSNLS